MRPTPEEKRYVHADGLGSIRTLTNADGLVTDRYQYTAFGETLSHLGDDPNPYQFAGEPFEPNVGFYYNRARWLDVASGRFVSVDPAKANPSQPLSLNKYAYAVLNPVGKRDPTGLFSIPEFKISLSISNFIATSLRFINIGFRILNQIDRIRDVIDTALVARNLLRAIAASTPQAAAAAVLAEIARLAGPEALNGFIGGFSEALKEIGPRWEEFSQRILAAAPRIAAESAPVIRRMLFKIAKFRRKGLLRRILFFPTPPGRRSDHTFIVNRKWAINVGTGGGRLFGVGFKFIKKSGQDIEPQIFRIDYSESRKLNLHYHIDSRTPGVPIP
ncbi:MAG: RHS repeat-associated core domain-containing protein [Acidobacteria bacterium]|nr:MAG: RHS repeat-associated core domain-containing protein [Acidobacteriota bacterium]